MVLVTRSNMDREDLFRQLIRAFSFEPTTGQQTVIRHLSAFLLSAKHHPAYLLKGYAGTGKTTLVTTLVSVLPQIGKRYVLLAPTGRAAKVLQNYTGKPASTIHRKLYQRVALADGTVQVRRVLNKYRDTVFIVDEASMIGTGGSDRSFVSKNGLLDDLIDYVTEGENCRLLLIGDQAQLPPVGTDESPALNFDGLKFSYSLTIASFELTEVMRQSLESGILFNATRLRQQLQAEEITLPFFKLAAFADIEQVVPELFEELLQDAFGSRDYTESVIVCRSNKRANLFNQAVRARILGMEGELASGDLLMVVKNNYFWLDQQDTSGFIANGDILTVQRINRFEDMYGKHFADVDVRLVDYPESPQLSVKIMLDTLMLETPSLSEVAFSEFSAEVEADYADIPSRRKRYAMMKTNPYFNALQVKFAYALTCHKTQGGQWPKVFVESGLSPDMEPDHQYVRWLYTAVTRATQKLYLVNFSDRFFDDEI